jgi:hypothetical protein
MKKLNKKIQELKNLRYKNWKIQKLENTKIGKYKNWKI